LLFRKDLAINLETGELYLATDSLTNPVVIMDILLDILVGVIF